MTIVIINFKNNLTLSVLMLKINNVFTMSIDLNFNQAWYGDSLNNYPNKLTLSDTNEGVVM